MNTNRWTWDEMAEHKVIDDPKDHLHIQGL